MSGCCWGKHYSTKFHQLLKDIDKGKYDKVPVRIGKRRAYALHNFKCYDSFNSSCCRSWKYQTRHRKQWMKNL